MKNKICILLVLISLLSFGQGYGDMYGDNIGYINKTKVVTFYEDNYTVIKKAINLKEESPIKDAQIDANIVNGYLLVTFYKIFEEIEGESQMYIYNNNAERVKVFPKKDTWTYQNPHVTKDFKLLQYSRADGFSGIMVIYDLENDVIAEECEGSGRAIIYRDNVIIISRRINLEEERMVFYTSDFNFKKLDYSRGTMLEIDNKSVSFKNEKASKIYFKNLDKYEIKK